VFSEEERRKAVERFVQFDLKAEATVRALGYPSSKTLRGWYREFQLKGLCAGGKKRKSGFSEEAQIVAVKYYLEHGRCAASTIRVLGYPGPDTLRKWLRAYDRSLIHEVSVSKEPFPDTIKMGAVIALGMGEDSAVAVARQVGVSRSRLYIWKSQMLGNEEARTLRRSPTRSATESETLRSELDELERQIQKLRLEHDILLKTTELLKKEAGINPCDLTNREKTLVIDALRAAHTVSEILESLSMASSCYFYHRARLAVPGKHVETRERIAQIFHESNRVYGYRRIHSALKSSGTVVSEKVVRRLMSEDKLTVITRRRRKYQSYQGEISPAVPNLIQRDFRAEKPNLKWLTDITEFQLPTSKVYLSPIIDCFDGMVISWAIGTCPDSNLANQMLDRAVERLGPTERPTVHSDRGGHYRWPGWINRMEGAGLTRSMSKKGCSPDNAACEGFFGRLKNEMFYNRTWLGTTAEQFTSFLDQYIRWYNEGRIKVSRGGRSPMAYRKSLGLSA